MYLAPIAKPLCAPWKRFWPHAPRKLSDARRNFRHPHHLKSPVRARLERTAAQAGYAARPLSFLRLRVSGALLALGYRRRRASAGDCRRRTRDRVSSAERARARDQPHPRTSVGESSALGVVFLNRWRTSRDAEASAGAVSRRGAQQAAVSVLDSADAIE